MNSKHTNLTRLIGLTAVVVAFLALAGTAGATSDYLTSTGGAYVAVVREAPLLPQYNVGAFCATGVTGGNYPQPTTTLYVRPPEVWSLPSYSSQSVAWQAVFVDSVTGATRYTGAWVGATAGRTEGTEFGSTFGDPASFNVYDNSYWSGSESYARIIGPTTNTIPYIRVAWLQSNGSWIYGLMRVHWVVYSGGYQRAYDGNC